MGRRIQYLSRKAIADGLALGRSSSPPPGAISLQADLAALIAENKSPMAYHGLTARAVVLAAAATFAMGSPAQTAPVRKPARVVGSSVRAAVQVDPIGQALARAKNNLAKFPPDEFGARQGEDSIGDLVGKSFSIETKPTVRYDEGILNIYLDAGHTEVDSKVGLPESPSVVGKPRAQSADSGSYLMLARTGLDIKNI